MKIMLAILVVTTSSIAFAQRPQSTDRNADLLSFVQNFKGRFPSEVNDRSAFEKTYSARTLGFMLVVDGLIYDDAKGLLTIDLGLLMPIPFIKASPDSALLSSCKTIGRATGTTVMGVRFNYSKQNCNWVAVKNGESADKTISIAATPAVYRSIKNTGIEIETVIQPQIGSGVVVDYERLHYGATLDEAYERDIHSYTITGQVRERRYYLMGAKNPLNIIATNQQEDSAAARVRLTAGAEKVLPTQQETSAARETMRNEYIARIRNKIQRFIVRPPNLQASAETEFDIEVLPDGNVLGVKLKVSSGNAAYDNAVERAISRAQPLPMPPDPALLKEFRPLKLKLRAQD